MTNFILIAICIISGLLFRRSGKLPKDAHKGINAWILYIALPAVSFKYIPTIHWNKELIVPALSPIIILSFAWVAVSIYKRFQLMDKPTESILKLTSGLSNTSFVGFPLVMAYFGEDKLSTAVICDQITFILLSTVGIITAIRTHQKEGALGKILIKRLALFPPFIGCISALIIPNFVDLSFLNPLFDKLAGTVGPLALFSVGLQLQFSEWKSEIKNISFALFYKLIIAPLIVFSFVLLIGLKGSIPQISVFEAAMPTLLTASVIADEFNLNQKLGNMIIGISIIFSFITTAIWWLIVQFIG